MRANRLRRLRVFASGAVALGVVLLAPLKEQVSGQRLPAPALIAAVPAPRIAAPAPPLYDARDYDIPVVFNDDVHRMIDAYCHRVRDRFEQGLVNASRFEPMVRASFKAEGLPQDLEYVALIESSFRPRASSHARAEGIWQFVNSTGRRFGLRSDRLVDERADPVKATDAAARFWKTLYAEYKDWHLAMAAYNAGEGRVSGAMRRTGLSNYWDLCRQNALPEETCNYVPGVIAAATIAKNPQRFGFLIRAQEPLRYDTVMIARAIDLKSLAKKSAIDLDELRKLNPELRTTRTPPSYRLIIPAESRFTIESSLTALPAPSRLDGRRGGRTLLAENGLAGHRRRRSRG